MNDLIVKIVKSFIPTVILKRRKNRQVKRILKNWKEAGSPVPPPQVLKQLTVGEYQQKSGYEVLVETGTYLGDMVEAQKSNFKKIFSIELGIDLFKKAQKRFKNNKNVFLKQGDSGKVLPHLLKEINEPAIFWLDGHYSQGITAKGDKDCPIFEELHAIFNSNKSLNHILLIDDARCFIGEGDYPSIDDLTAYIRNKNEKYQVEVKDDIIRCVIS